MPYLSSVKTKASSSLHIQYRYLTACAVYLVVMTLQEILILQSFVAILLSHALLYSACCKLCVIDDIVKH